MQSAEIVEVQVTVTHRRVRAGSSEQPLRLHCVMSQGCPARTLDQKTSHWWWLALGAIVLFPIAGRHKHDQMT